MPTRLDDVTAALCTEQLVSQFAGVDLFSRGAETVTAPDSWDRFPTIHDLLNGLCSPGEIAGTGGTIAGESLGEVVTQYAADDTPTIVATFTAGIDSEDRIYIESETAAFSVKAICGDVLGFTDQWTDSEVIGTRRRVTAPNDWIRGSFLCGNDPGSGLIEYRIRYGAGNQEFTFFPPLGTMPGVLEWVRPNDLTDSLANANASNLTALDRNAGPHVTTRWFLNSEGKVVCSRPYFVDDLEWLSTEFRDWLGFTGDETAVNQNATGHWLLTATHAPQGLLWLDRPIEGFEPEISATRQGQKLSDSRFEQSHITTTHGWRLRFAVTGLASNVDRLLDAQENFFGYLWRSEFFTVYLNVDEKRIAVREKTGYSPEVTGQDDRRMGCHRLVLDLGINGMGFALEDPEVRSRYFLELLGWNLIGA